MANNDASLVRDVLNGVRPAYGDLYDRYAGLVRAICFDKTGNLSEAQDLAQEVFLRAYRKLETLRNPDHFGKWLVGIARTTCLEWLRKHSREKRTFVRFTPEASPAVMGPSGDGEIEELQKAMRQLPERERLALHAFYLQEESAEQARSIMGLSRSGFYRVLKRARGRLAGMLRDETEGKLCEL